MNAVTNAQVWHRWLSHINKRSLELVNRKNGNGVAFDGSIADCDVCAVGKSHQLAHPKKANHAAINAPFQLGYGDLIGPFKPTAHVEYKFVSKITDQFTKWTAVYLLCSKDQARVSLQLFVTSTVIPLGKRIIRWRADKGGEFMGDEFKYYCLGTDITQQFAATNTPQQTGVSKRIRRTLCGMVRCMLGASELPPFLWGELMMTASYLCNRIPHSALKMKTPYTML